MKHVGIKEFQRNVYKYLKKLPITLTRNGSPIATIYAGSDLRHREKKEDTVSMATCKHGLMFCHICNSK